MNQEIDPNRLGDAESKRVLQVQNELQRERIAKLERESELLKMLLRNERLANANPRAAGRADALEAIARINPVKLMQSMVEYGEGGKMQFNKKALGAALGVGEKNPIESVIHELETACLESAERLLAAQLRSRALERQLEVAHEAPAPQMEARRLEIQSSMRNRT